MLPFIGGPPPSYALKSVVQCILIAGLISFGSSPGALHAQLGAIAVPVSVIGLKVPSAITLSGTVNQGSTSARETGNVTLQLKVDGSTSETWNLSSGQRSFVSYPFAARKNCKRTDSKGVSTELATAGCFQAVPWFAPWIADSMAENNIATLLDGSTAADKAAGVQEHLFSLTMPVPKDSKSRSAQVLAAIAAESAVLVTYDASTHLVKRVDFNETPPASPLSKIETYVLFSDYRMESGFPIPHHIQRYVQRSLQADIQINSVTIQ